MNYHCPPDVDRTKNLTANAVRLFQRFRQDTDLATLSTWLDEETARHVKLCELSILYHASCGFYWAPLPHHPISDVNVWADLHLEKMGFKIEHSSRGRKYEVPDEMNRDSRLQAVVVEHKSTASWSHAPASDRDHISAEWRRREQLEDEDRAANPPTPTTEIADGEIKGSSAVWAAVLDKKYLVEVQRIHGRNFLCLFDLGNRQCVHFERTNVAFGAMFGPDAGDVAQWQERAMQIVDVLK
jgi:hypothetical protein